MGTFLQFLWRIILGSEKLVFLGLILSIPFQKRTFLFGPSPEGEGFFEWTSGFLYFTDILIMALAVLWITKLSRLPRPVLGKIGIRIFPEGLLLLFLGFAFISITQAELVDVGAYRFIKLGEFIFLFFYIAVRARDIGIKRILQVFVMSGVFQSVIAILQFAKQSSLGLHIFHESTLQIGMRGVAQITGGGAAEMIRAYGTFTNPNVLAGFLGICLIFLFYLWGRQCYFLAHSRPPSRGLRGSDCFAPDCGRGTMPKQPSNPPESNTVSPDKTVFLERYLLLSAVFILSFGILLTFSRGVIIFFIFTSALFFGGIFLFRKLQQYRKSAIYLLVLVAVSWALIIALMWPEVSSRFLESSASEPAISERLFFNAVGVETATKNHMPMFFGIGIGNFVNHYMGYLPDLAPHLYQPVHNIFILIASEIGVLGLISFVLFLSLLVGQAVRMLISTRSTRPGLVEGENYFLMYSLLFIIFYLLLIAMYDHYFWTLQQGSLMFWVSLGLLVSLREMSRRDTSIAT